MKTARKIGPPRLAMAGLTVILIVALAGAAYAADVGGIRRSIQIWVHGDQTDAILELPGDGSYQLSWEDEDGESHSQSGGGVAFDALGNERPVTEAEIREHLDSPEVEYREDGSVWVSYREQVLEITDKFDAGGVCFVQLKKDGGTLYLTVKYDNGYATSPHGFVQPWEFN